MRVLHLSMFVLVLAATTAPAPPTDARVKVWVELRDKGPASAFLSGRALEDAAVHTPYLERLQTAGLEISVTLKWQNRVSGWIDASRLAAVRALPFVRAVQEMPRKVYPPAPPAGTPPRSPPSSLGKSAAHDFGEFENVFVATEIAVLRDTIAARGLGAGEGLRIAVMDADFLIGHQAFDSLRASGRIVDQWDFVGDTSAAAHDVLGTSHGASVLSLLVGRLPGSLEGIAPDAEYLLYRTEDEFTEDYVEEDYLAAAMERAVDSGAQVINISLGYRYDFDTLPRFPYSEMDGRTRPSSLAALGAARRGALVVVAIGNEGAERFGESTVTAPADADSILAVGMVGGDGARCGYSGTGPTHDGRIKPDLSSLGCVVRVVNPSTSTGAWNTVGTSVGAPVVAGIAALLLQLHPDPSGSGDVARAQRIRRELMATAASSASPDNATGRGLVRAAAAHRALRQPVTGVLAWRDGRMERLPWAGVRPAGSRLWDIRGRVQRVQGDWGEHGEIEIRTERRMAPGSYILKIPRHSGRDAP